MVGTTARLSALAACAAAAGFFFLLFPPPGHAATSIGGDEVDRPSAGEREGGTTVFRAIRAKAGRPLEEA